jgi:heat shock protein HslJ
MTDEQMDARLRGAGEAWRTADAAAVADAGNTGEVHDVIEQSRTTRRRHRWSLIASAAAVVVLAGAAAALVANVGSNGGNPAATDGGATQLTGTPWTLIGITDSNGNEVPVAGDAVLLIGADHNVKGSDGCNAMGGAVDVSDDTIGIGGGLSMTEMACLDAQVTATASHVDAVLSGDVKWSISGDQLTLTKSGAGQLVYRAAPASTKSMDPNDLINATWHLTTIEKGTGSDGVAHTPAQTQKLRIEKRLTFDAGCNAYSADATVGKGTLDIGTVGGTLALCKGGDEGEVLAVLTGKVTWVIEGDQLTITKDVVGALIYSRTDPSAGSTPLTGTQWTFSSIEVTSSNSASGEGGIDSTITLTLDAKRSYRLETGCHSYAGEAALTDNSVAFSNQQDLGGDDCLKPLAERVVDFLDGDVGWSIKDGQLTLTKGDTTLTFSAK